MLSDNCKLRLNEFLVFLIFAFNLLTLNVALDGIKSIKFFRLIKKENLISLTVGHLLIFPIQGYIFSSIIHVDDRLLLT